jgi:hypothetical protein
MRNGEIRAEQFSRTPEYVRISGNVAVVMGRETFTPAATSELGVRFEDAIDVIALLNRKLVSQSRDRRTMPRVEVRCPVHVKAGGNFWVATLRNISANGLQLEGDDLPAIGVYVTLFIEGLNIPSGEVVWKRGRLAGIEVIEELSWTSIIPWIRATVKNGAN